MRRITIFSLLVICVIAAKAQSQKTLADKIIAVVGDRIILQSDITNIIEDAKRQGNDLTGEECVLIEQAMASKILALQAEKDSLPVTDEDVEARLDLMLRHFSKQPNSEISPETIHQLKAAARQPVRERMLAEAMQEKVTRYIRITPSEVQSFFNKIPVDSLPYFESELEIGQIIYYPDSDIELYKAIARLDTVRTRMMAGEISFNKAATLYSNDDATRYSPYVLNIDGSYHVPVDRLNKEMVMLISKMKPGEYSQPGSFINEQGRKGIRIVYFKSRTEPHRMNMEDDYARISYLALEQKKVQALNKWFTARISDYYITVDNDTQGECEEVKKYVSSVSKD